MSRAPRTPFGPRKTPATPKSGLKTVHERKPQIKEDVDSFISESDHRTPNSKEKTKTETTKRVSQIPKPRQIGAKKTMIPAPRKKTPKKEFPTVSEQVSSQEIVPLEKNEVDHVFELNISSGTPSPRKSPKVPSEYTPRRSPKIPTPNRIARAPSPTWTSKATPPKPRTPRTPTRPDKPAPRIEPEEVIEEPEVVSDLIEFSDSTPVKNDTVDNLIDFSPVAPIRQNTITDDLISLLSPPKNAYEEKNDSLLDIISPAKQPSIDMDDVFDLLPPKKSIGEHVRSLLGIPYVGERCIETQNEDTIFAFQERLCSIIEVEIETREGEIIPVFSTKLNDYLGTHTEKEEATEEFIIMDFSPHEMECNDIIEPTQDNETSIIPEELSPEEVTQEEHTLLDEEDQLDDFVVVSTQEEIHEVTGDLLQLQEDVDEHEDMLIPEIQQDNSDEFISVEQHRDEIANDDEFVPLQTANTSDDFVAIEQQTVQQLDNEFTTLPIPNGEECPSPVEQKKPTRPVRVAPEPRKPRSSIHKEESTVATTKPKKPHIPARASTKPKKETDDDFTTPPRQSKLSKIGDISPFGGIQSRKQPAPRKIDEEDPVPETNDDNSTQSNDDDEWITVSQTQPPAKTRPSPKKASRMASPSPRKGPKTSTFRTPTATEHKSSPATRASVRSKKPAEVTPQRCVSPVRPYMPSPRKSAIPAKKGVVEDQIATTVRRTPASPIKRSPVAASKKTSSNTAMTTPQKQTNLTEAQSEIVKAMPFNFNLKELRSMYKTSPKESPKQSPQTMRKSLASTLVSADISDDYSD